MISYGSEVSAPSYVVLSAGVIIIIGALDPYIRQIDRAIS